ncbi:beta-glucuronidase [Spirochaetia bacterium]|nr:beta-glucuronidase [Spirochaetia bacterium]
MAVFQEDIHNTAYEAKYREPRLESGGLINTAGRNCESLNGRWNFAADWYDTCRRADWFKEVTTNAAGLPQPVDWDWEGWERIPVPACWNLEKPELHYFEGTGVYTRTFRYVPKEPGERLILRFEGAAYNTCVFVNGTFVGSHDGASTPFNVDITAAVKTEDFSFTENRIVVTVDARRSPLRIPMDNTDWFLYGGIYRDVYLYRLPPVFIKDWFVRLATDGGIDADVYIANAEGGKVQGTVCLKIPELGVQAEAAVQDGKASFHVKANAERWSPESPKLYEVTLGFTAADGKTRDQTHDRIGFREIAVNGTDVLLNGKKIFLKGVSVHEDHFALGKTTNEDIIRQTIRDLKEMNGYYLRLAHYPHDARFAKIADEEGVLLWEEVPVYWAVAFDNPGTYADAENQLAELVLRDRNRASVIIWSVGNENADTDSRFAFMSGLAKKAKALDPTRPVSAACLINHDELRIEDRLTSVLDIIGINEYLGWYDPDFSKLPKILANSAPGKPVVITEFGGDARTGQRGTADDLWTEDKQKALYEQQIAVIKQCSYIAGMTPWIFYDFRCPRRLNRYQEHFNRKGLIDADRVRHKGAFYVMRQFYGE